MQLGFRAATRLAGRGGFPPFRRFRAYGRDRRAGRDRGNRPRRARAVTVSLVTRLQTGAILMRITEPPFRQTRDR